jgi:hypothetical protein
MALLVAAGCTQPQMKMLQDKRYTPRPEDFPIELYASDVQTPRDEIAILDSAAVQILTTDTRRMLVEDMRQRARKLGADAVTNVVMLIRPERGWVPDPQTPFRSYRQGWRDYYFLRGRAVRFKPFLVETGNPGAGAEKFHFAEGERPEIEPPPRPGESDRTRRRLPWPSRRAIAPTPKPKQPTLESGG